jgi:tetratricopeptide (TPR) repeat protein
MYERAGTENPDHNVLYRMAVCLMKQNKFKDALGLLDSTILSSSPMPAVCSAYIRCCLETGHEWAEHYKALDLDGLSFSELYELAGSFASKEHYDKAGCLYSFMDEKFKDMDVYSRRMVYHNLACVYRSLGSCKGAVDMLDKIPQEYLGSELYMDLGCLYYDIGNLNKSREMFSKASGEDRSGIVDFNLGLIKMKENRLDDALDYFSKSILTIIENIRSMKPLSRNEYGPVLMKLYLSCSLCQTGLGDIDSALLSIDRAGQIERSDKVQEILSNIQREYLRGNGNSIFDIKEMNHFMESCITVRTGFTDGIRRLLDGLIGKIYGEHKKRSRVDTQLTGIITGFIRNEKRIYDKYADSIERTEGTFQRYVDNLLLSFERRMAPEQEEVGEGYSSKDKCITDPVLECQKLIELGDSLFENFEYTCPEEYVYASLIPYYRAVKLLSTSRVFPYYERSLEKLPIPEDMDGFRKIGIYSYKAGGKMCYRIDFSFDISCSQYLFEINCSPGLRSRYINGAKHYMPWDKLLWMISGIKKKWNVIDDAKSAGLLLLFYEALYC